MLVFIVIHAGFTCSLFVVAQRSSTPDDLNAASIEMAFLHLWFVALGDNLGGILSTYTESETPALILLIYLAWVLISSVLMLNLL